MSGDGELVSGDGELVSGDGVSGDGEPVSGDGVSGDGELVSGDGVSGDGELVSGTALSDSQLKIATNFICGEPFIDFSDPSIRSSCLQPEATELLENGNFSCLREEQSKS